jgi:hypothetical protein
MPARRDKTSDQKSKPAAGSKAGATTRPQGALRRAERRVEEAVKDVVAEVENRVILAGEAADESTSSEVNILSAVEVAIHPPHPDDRRAGTRKPKKQP